MNYYGAGGLIIASCLSTIMRTAYNVNTFKQYLFPVSEGIPATNVLVVYASILASGLAARAVLGIKMCGKYLIDKAILGSCLGLALCKERCSLAGWCSSNIKNWRIPIN